MSAVALNVLGFNPMKALIWSGVVLKNRRGVVGARTTGRLLNTLGWATTITSA